MTDLKRILILEASGFSTEKAEFDKFSQYFKLIGLDVTRKEVYTKSDLIQTLSENKNLDYLLLCAHNKFSFDSGFCITTQIQTTYSPHISWSEFSTYLCNSNCLKKNSTLLLASCSSGRESIAITLIENCNQFLHIVGTNIDVTLPQVLESFTSLLNEIEVRKLELEEACKNINENKKSELELNYYNRDILKMSPSYLNRYDIRINEIFGDTIKDN